jgi:hypothetical protein
VASEIAQPFRSSSNTRHRYVSATLSNYPQNFRDPLFSLRREELLEDVLLQDRNNVESEEPETTTESDRRD